jgi:hypothetical protein
VNVNSKKAVGSYQVTIGYDPATVLLSASNVTGGNGAGFTEAPLSVNARPGSATINSFQVGQSPIGAFSVAQMAFTAVAAGTSSLTLTVGTVSDTLGNDLEPSEAQISLSSDTISVTSGTTASNAVNLRVVERGDVSGNRAVNIADALVVALTAAGVSSQAFRIPWGISTSAAVRTLAMHFH